MEVAPLEIAGGTIARFEALNEAIPESSPHPEDLALAQRAVQRDERAWREIYDASRDRLFALLCYHTGRREEALELLQETYLSAIKNLHRYRGDGPLISWLAVIAIRRAKDWKRKLMSWKRQQEAIRMEQEPQPATNPDRDARRKLQDALSNLKGNQRGAFLLREMEGMSFREIGEALGCNEAPARVHFHRARQALQSFLSPGPEEAEMAGATQQTHDGRVGAAKDQMGETTS
jgi:RNA polymerase sigma-70 factor (ECF subfamily)